MVFAIVPICDDYNGPCFSHVAVRQCSLIRSVEKVFDLKIQKNVRSIKLSVHNPSLRTTATQSQGGVQGAVTLSMEDSGWATRKYYSKQKSSFITFNFKKILAGQLKQPTQNNCGRLHRQHDIFANGKKLNTPAPGAKNS